LHFCHRDRTFSTMVITPSDCSFTFSLQSGWFIYCCSTE
jgi:hypothetical protein